jgi:hypothetical protein
MDQYKFIEFNTVKLFVMKCGSIFRFLNNRWQLVKNRDNANGYNRIQLNKKTVKRHRLLCFVFKNLDINNPKLQVDHIDGDRLNNNLDNLRIVNNQQNQWNQTKAKGYYWHKGIKKWEAQIKVNSKKIPLGYYTNEEDARQAYLNAKLQYHLIHN